VAIAIQPFETGHSPAVADFNRRLAAAGSKWRFPEHPEPSWLARAPGSPVFQEFFVAANGAFVRGVYALQHRPAAIGGEEVPVGCFYLPISEGMIDRRFTLVAALLLRDAIRREPLSYTVGMPGADSQAGKLVAALGCERRAVPFFVRVEHGARFAREARYLRRKPALARALDLAAASGLATPGAKLVRLALRRGPGLGDAGVETLPGFGAWADEVWQRCRGRYSFVALRDAATLNRVYPAADEGLERVRVVRGGQTLGWAVLQRAELQGDPTFGSLHVGRINDCLAAPEDAGVVIRAAADTLAARGVDLMLSNQLHPAWGEALGRNAFLPVPSNFVLGPTAALAARIRAHDPELRNVHMNRGDGDSPWAEIRHGAWSRVDRAA
jgi:hypothetical protein